MKRAQEGGDKDKGQTFEVYDNADNDNDRQRTYFDEQKTSFKP